MTEFSNIITPPDFPSDTFHSVTLIDPIPSEIENIALFMKTATKSFNLYVYDTSMNDQEWLNKVLKKSNAVIINTVINEGTTLKDKLAVNPDTFHYGPKNFLMNKNQLTSPIDYFINYTQQGAVE